MENQPGYNLSECLNQVFADIWKIEFQAYSSTKPGLIGIGATLGLGATLGAQSIMGMMAKSRAQQQMEATSQLNPGNMLYGGGGLSEEEMMFM
jgi:hypothetical protein